MPGVTMSHLFLIPSISTLILSSLSCAQAYIPAIPINDTSSMNLTDSSTISISWRNPPGVYSGSVSYQLEADIPTNGTTAGALVHFSESTMGPNLTTSTPWIAFISCDVNETGTSMEDDVFTLARDRGAVSALLYTTQSATCALNPRYIKDFEKPLDVFATRSVQIARVIDSQFRHTNETYLVYDGKKLNETGATVNASLITTRNANALNETTYLIGTLQARNSTGQATPTDIPGTTQSPAAATNSRVSPSMIALYTITGLIGTCFILMLLLGWRRARRHPERYGRREEDGEAPRTTAAGLAQAILETFPVIKFNRRGGAGGQFGETVPKRLDSDNELSVMTVSPKEAGGTGDAGAETTRVQSSRATSGKTMSRPTSGSVGDGAVLGGVVEAEGTGDICPICLLEFEEGDDLRVLPCEREHMYHQGCIDPWLLRVSGSCPLCRKDFNVTEPPSTSLAVPAIASSSTSTPASQSPPTEPQGGFARYLAFMRRERRRTRRRADTNATAASGVSERSEGDSPGQRVDEEEIESVVWGPGPRGRSASGPAIGVGGGGHGRRPSSGLGPGGG